ncbi:glutamate-rich protein 3 [Etheostoma cragini]|uniref:glutamate-rich protein 3 n=1 Tax=Etheostoma cragini TaxID=417921 RepID=UPI00155F06E2|nr:glutamate-rich protein 3 [Etheostoma cragini]
MSHLNPGLLSAYNSLKDKHLAGYFSNTRIRRHLQRAGLITRSGRIVPDKEYRHKLIQKAHQRHIRECLAQAIFHKVLEMERVHQIEIKRKLEEFSRRERVHKIKVERSKRFEEDIIRILSPRPPTGARGIQKQHSGPEGDNSESSESPGSSRPNTAPGTMQRPVRLKPIHSNNTTASLRRSSPYRLPESSKENDQLLNCTMDKDSRRRLTTMEPYRGISPYCLPVINNFVTPVPPATKRKDRVSKVPLSSTLRGRRLRPTTDSSGADLIEDTPMLRSSVHQSRVCVNMIYFGKTVHLSHDVTDMRDEVKVFQQHCGGENLCVFKGKLHEGETFQFISRRHRGFPFSLTFFLNGLQVERLSSCCEFKHRKGPRLGGRHGHFGFCGVEGASPCYKCIIAMGLDKKPTPPPKRVKEHGGREEAVLSPKDGAEMETERTGDNASSHSEYKTSQPQDVKTQVKKETADEDKVRDDYEEDFEADDEGPADDDRAKEKKSSSPSRGTQRQVKEESDASETEDDENDEDMKSRSGSSFSGTEQEESDAEATKDSREDEKAEPPIEVDQEETTVLPDEKNDEPNQEEAAEAPKDSEVQGSAGDSPEIDNSISSGNENKQSDNTLEEKEVEKTLDESKQELEQARAKSVQEKLAEAILKESECNSEPELSDTSTEEEESIEKCPNQYSIDAEQKHTLVKETKCEEAVCEDEVVQHHEEMSEPRGQDDETQQVSQDKKVEIEDGDEKTASKEDKKTDNDKSENTEDTGAALHPVSEQEMADGDKTLEHQEDAATKSADGETAEEDKGSEEKTAAEVDTQPGETGRGAKSSEEDESSISELNKNPDETASPDDAEAEAMTARETMEMKAEPSEEQETLNCEEAPVTDTEKRQQKDSKDSDAGSETEVTAENSSSSLEGSGDTTVEKTADISEENAKDESSKDGVEEEEVSAVEASKDDNPQEKDNLGKEETDKSPVEIEDKVEEKCEEEGQEKEKQTNLDDITEGENREESEKDDKNKTEEEENESKTAESMENKDSNSELTKSGFNTEGKANEEQDEKTHSEEDNVAKVEKADESDKTERDKDSVGNKNDEQQSEENGAATDETNEVETAADGKKDDEFEKEEKDQNEDIAKNEGDEESQERKVDETVGGEEISEITEESEKSADANLVKDVKIPDENMFESEDVADSEPADVAQGTKTAEETPSDVMEAEDVEKETKGGSDNSEKGEVDVENGEISTVAASKTCEDEGEAQTEGKDDGMTADNTNDERTEEPAAGESTEVKEVTDESTENNSEPETAVRELKEEFKLEDGEEIEQDEKVNLSDPDRENGESDLIKKSDDIQSNASEVIIASSGDQAQSLTPEVVNSDDTAHKLDDSTAPSDAETDKHPHVDENAAAAAAALSVADGENGADTEEASKASEEGASVLLKPHAQASQLTQINGNTEESAAVGTATPEALAREDNRDLVTNWITMHQTSKYFETFVEPLEDLKESASDAQISDANEEVTQSTELPRSQSSLQMAKMSGNAEQERMPKDVTESKDKSKEEAAVSNLESNHSEDGELCEKDILQVEEETEVEIIIAKAEGEQNDKESVNGQDMRSEGHKGSRGSEDEDRVHEGFMQDSAKQTAFSITEVERIADSHHSVTSGRPESVHENQTEEETTDVGPELNDKQTAVEEVKDLLPSSKTDEQDERTTSPEGLSKSDEPKDIKETWAKSNDQSREVTEITDFTTSKSDDGSQEESPHEDIQHKPSDESISGEGRDMQLIQDIKRTLSKDRLSTFSVDETLFAQSPYPLLTAARTESGH